MILHAVVDKDPMSDNTEIDDFLAKCGPSARNLQIKEGRIFSREKLKHVDVLHLYVEVDPPVQAGEVFRPDDPREISPNL